MYSLFTYHRLRTPEVKSKEKTQIISFASAALFLEFWKRYSREIIHRWDVTGFTPEEEHPRPEYLEQLKNVEEKTMNFVTQTVEPRVSRTMQWDNFEPEHN